MSKAGTDKVAKQGQGVHIAVYVLVIFVWVALDRITKMIFETGEPGGIIGGPYAGLFQFRLVHNTGGAWGIFSGYPWALGIFSIVVCIGLAVFFVATLKHATPLQTVALALVTAGGIGNAIDRFAQGFVTDFIEFSFIDFPVFNVADIGVTCGIALLAICFILEWRHDSDSEDEEE